MTDFSFNGEIASPPELSVVPENLADQGNEKILLVEQGSVAVFIVREPDPVEAELIGNEITTRDEVFSRPELIPLAPSGEVIGDEPSRVDHAHSETPKLHLVVSSPEGEPAESEVTPPSNLLDYLEQIEEEAA